MNITFNHAETMIVYICLFVFSTIFSIIAEKTNRVKYVWLIIVVLSVFCGIRSVNVGVDTASYFQILNEYGQGSYPPEIGSRTLFWLLMTLTHNTNMSFIVISFITNSSILLTLWSLRNIINYRYTTLFFYLYYYFMTYSGIRQWLAIGLVFIAIKFLFSNKTIGFICFVLLASTIHYAALFAIVIWPIYKYVESTVTKKNKKYKIVFVLIPILILVYYLIVKYNHYLQIEYILRDNYDSGFMQVVKFILLISFSFNYFKINNKRITLEKYNNTIECDDTYQYEKILIKTSVFLYLTFILIQSTGYFLVTLDRIGLYLVPFELFIFGKVLSNKNITIEKVITITIIAYVFVSLLLSDGYSLIPYEMCF